MFGPFFRGGCLKGIERQPSQPRHSDTECLERALSEVTNPSNDAWGGRSNGATAQVVIVVSRICGIGSRNADDHQSE